MSVCLFVMFYSSIFSILLKHFQTTNVLGTISQTGSANVQTSLIGTTKISAFMTRATHNKAQVSQKLWI